MRSACSAGRRRRDDLEAQATDGAEVAPLATRHGSRTALSLRAEPLSMSLEDIVDIGLTAKDCTVGEVAHTTAQHLANWQCAAGLQYRFYYLRTEARFQGLACLVYAADLALGVE